MHLICATSPRAAEPDRSVLAHLPGSKGPMAAHAFRILGADHGVRLLCGATVEMQAVSAASW
jgi:hypothetical protein